MCSAFIFIERIGSRSMEAKKRKCGDDAVSNLPDELLCHILSFLPTKEAALTSVLSKRWRDLFALVASLDLDDSIFVPGDRPIVCERTSFVEFVDRALALYPHSPITKFSVTFERGVDKYLVERWIFYALLRHRVSDLTLMWHSPPSGFSLPSTILHFGQWLVKLKLGCGKVRLFDVLTHGHLIFRKLKTLHLDTIHFDAVRKEFALLLSKCPVLEELIVNGLNSYCLSLAPVSAPTLKRLTIDCEHDLTDLDTQIYAENHIFYFGTEAPDNVSFDTPNLLYLNYSDFVACNYPLVKLDSLVEARLDLGLTWGHMCARDSDDEFKVRGDATNLIMGMHKVQTLYLSSDTLEVISYFCETIPVFHNLNHLSIESDDERGWQSLPQLLINCPNLQTLVFHGLHHMITEGCGDACDCISHHSSSSSCLSSCPVRILKILEFGATCAEMSLVEHFLKNMPQLEQVIVVLHLESSQEGDFDLYEVSHALEMAPRASPNCMLEIVNRGIVLLPKKNVV